MYKRLQDLTNLYFQSFENKDIKSLSKLFDDDIKLYDPIVKEIIGKKNVLEVNSNIFQNCKSLRFTKVNILVDTEKFTAVGEVEFYCDDTLINVVDLIEFNKNFLITSITAYLDTGVLK